MRQPFTGFLIILDSSQKTTVHYSLASYIEVVCFTHRRILAIFDTQDRALERERQIERDRERERQSESESERERE